MNTEEVMIKYIKKMERFNDRKSVSEGLLVAILNELSEINKKLPEIKKPKKVRKKK